MDRAVKAALLSALVFPGAGQWYLGRRLAACVFALPALAAAWYFASAVLARAAPLIDEIVSGKLEPDLLAVLARVQQQGQDAAPATNLAMLVMLACWAGAIVHAWLAGRART